MIVMVSTKTLRAREPDHSASTKPTEMTSNRPPSQHGVEGRRDDVLDGLLGQPPRGQVDDRAADLGDVGRRELLGDVADGTGQREDQRRHRQHREEGRLGRQPGDAVAHAGADGGDDQAPHLVAQRPPTGPRTESQHGMLRTLLGHAATVSASLTGTRILTRVSPPGSLPARRGLRLRWRHDRTELPGVTPGRQQPGTAARGSQRRHLRRRAHRGRHPPRAPPTSSTT